MASKKPENKNQPKETKSISARIMQVIFLILSIMIVLSMILSATATY